MFPDGHISIGGNLKIRVLLPLLGGLGVLLLAFVYGASWVQREEMADSRGQTLKSAGDLMQTHLSRDTSMMDAVLDVIAGDATVREEFRQQDRAGLVASLEERFEVLRSQHGLSHLYFISPERMTLVRMHRPDFFGDVISRKSMLTAELTGKPSSGIEVGKYRGLLTLRVVHPWYEGDQLLGYVEAGKEIGYMLDGLASDLDLELFAIIDKQHVQRGFWEDGMDALGRESNWDRLATGLVVRETMDGMPPGVVDHWVAQSAGREQQIIGEWVNDHCYEGGSLPIWGANNTLLGRIVVLRDVTTLVERASFSLLMAALLGFAVFVCLGLALVPFLGRVERVIREEFVQLAETKKELVVARDQAFAASAAKSDFLATMSHEIRTPMNGVLGMISLLLQTETTDEQQEFAETVQYSAESLLIIINDILDFSKVEAGMIELSPVEASVAKIMDESLNLLSEQAQEKGLEIISVCKPGVPEFLLVDDVRLRQIFVNLLGNAVKFTEEGQVTVEVEMVSETDQEVVLKFGVRDTGIGIPASAQPGLFDAFTQADTSTTREFGGTGLGLSICKSLVELMGGEISVESQQGVGTCFSFTVRLETVENSKLEPASRLEGMRVLCLASCETKQKAWEYMLSDWGASAVSFSYPGAALLGLRVAAKAGDHFDAVLISKSPNETMGFELAKSIQKEPGLGVVRVLMSTSIAENLSEERALEHGICGTFIEPVRRESLNRALVKRPQKTGEAEPLQLQENTEQGPGAFTGYRILLVEDNAINARIAILALAPLGCDIDHALDGVQAVEATSSTNYDAILMDCQMPNMDGFEATRLIRENEGEASHTPIIALTANAVAGDRERCVEAGMDDYVSKPIKPKHLSATLASWLTRAAS